MEIAALNGVRIAYARRGQGVPLILLHGYPLDHSIWEPLYPLLAGQFDLILPDLRGFGRSEVVEAPYSVVDMAADVAALLDHLGIQGAAIAGHSMGGYVALAFARACPGRLRGLGLISSQAGADTPERKQGRYATATEILEKGVGPVAASMPAKLSPNVVIQARLRRLIAAQQPAGLAGALKAMAERLDSTFLLVSPGFPVVIVHGAKDELIPIERAREVEAAVPHAHLVEVAEAGHMPMMEAPQITAQALIHLLSPAA